MLAFSSWVPQNEVRAQLTGETFCTNQSPSACLQSLSVRQEASPAQEQGLQHLCQLESWSGKPGWCVLIIICFWDAKSRGEGGKGRDTIAYQVLKQKP